jgi:branched-subunit amino acid ABC-type transport system permease component
MNPQILLNGLINAALIAPPAVAFTILLGVLRFTNFAVGAYVTVGAFAAYFVNVQLGQPLIVAALAAMLVTAFVVWLTDVLVFRPLKDHDSVALLVVSIALAFILEQCVRLIYGGSVRGFNLPLERPMRFWDMRITHEQVLIIAISAAAAIAVHLLMNHTPLGRAMRATADNPTLAEVRGIRRNVIVGITWLVCGALFGLTGVLAGLDLVIEPLIGWNLTIPIIAAAILGGAGSAGGALLGAILVGVAEELSTLVLPPTYKVAVGFVIIALLLLFRPHGLLGQPEIKK